MVTFWIRQSHFYSNQTILTLACPKSAQGLDWSSVKHGSREQSEACSPHRWTIGCCWVLGERQWLSSLLYPQVRSPGCKRQFETYGYTESSGSSQCVRRQTRKTWMFSRALGWQAWEEETASRRLSEYIWYYQRKLINIQKHYLLYLKRKTPPLRNLDGYKSNKLLLDKFKSLDVHRVTSPKIACTFCWYI